MRPLSGLGLINLVDGFVSGGLAVLTVVIAIEVLGAGDAGTGWLNAAIGLGGLIGALLAGPMTLGRRLDLPLAVGGVTLGVGIILVGQSEVLLAAIAAIAVATAGMLVLEVVATTIFQREVPDAIRGRTIGAMDTVTVVGLRPRRVPRPHPGGAGRAGRRPARLRGGDGGGHPARDAGRRGGRRRRSWTPAPSGSSGSPCSTACPRRRSSRPPSTCPASGSRPATSSFARGSPRIGSSTSSTARSR